MRKMVTYTGRMVDPLRISVSDIDIRDIAHSLSNTCRFNGHCREFYSVAQHSIIVSFMVDKEYALAGLLHDAAEAYLGDVITPLKGCLNVYDEDYDTDQDYETAELELLRIIFDRFRVPKRGFWQVRECDKILLLAELSSLTRFDTGYKNVSFPRLYNPEKAEMLFLERFLELWPGEK